MKFLLAILTTLTLTVPANAIPLCGEQQMPCWSDTKIDEAQAILKRRGQSVDRDFIISIEINRGKFHSARALADWISFGDR